MCPVSAWYWSYSSSYFNCYTFNFHVNSSGQSTDSFTQMGLNVGAAGLSLQLDMEHRLYENTTSQSGIKLVIHPRHLLPDIEGSSYMLAPGVSTYMGVRRKYISRQPAPYSSCIHVDQALNEEMNFYADRYNYSQVACRMTCLQVMSILDKDCCISDYPCNPLNKTTVFEQSIPQSSPYCSSGTSRPASSSAAGAGGGPGTKSEATMDCENVCLPSCIENQYEVKIADIIWPASGNSQTQEILEYLKGKVNGFSAMDDDVQYIFARRNMLELRVYYESLEVESYESSPKYDGNILFSSFGGVLGLCIGFSALTAMELVELIVDLLCCLCRCRTRKVTSS